MKIFTLTFTKIEGNPYPKKGDLVNIPFEMFQNSLDGAIATSSEPEDMNNTIFAKQTEHVDNWFESKTDIKQHICGMVKELDTTEKDVRALVSYGRGMTIYINADILTPIKLDIADPEVLEFEGDVSPTNGMIKSHHRKIFSGDLNGKLKTMYLKMTDITCTEDQQNFIIENMIANLTKLYDFEKFTESDMIYFKENSTLPPLEEIINPYLNNIVNGGESVDFDSPMTRTLDDIQKITPIGEVNVDDLEDDPFCIIDTNDVSEFMVTKEELIMLLSMVTNKTIRSVEDITGTILKKDTVSVLTDNMFEQIIDIDLRDYFRGIVYANEISNNKPTK